MRIPAWRVALTGGAIIVLAVAGIGFAAASGIPSTKASTSANAGTTASDTSAATDTDLGIDLASSVESNDKLGPADGAKLKRLLRLGRHLVHAGVTVTDKDGNLVRLQLDHGTVQSIGGGTLVISEAGGGTETVSTSDETIVHLGRTKSDLSKVSVGAEVFVQSRIDGGTTLAKRIIVIPTGA